MLLRPVDGEGAAVEEDDDEGFAGGREGFEELLLRGGELDVGAVAAGEAFDVNGHLFAFELGGEADEGEDDVGFLGGGDGFLLQAAGFGKPIQREAGAEEGSAVVIDQLEDVGPGVGEGQLEVRGVGGTVLPASGFDRGNLVAIEGDAYAFVVGAGVAVFEMHHEVIVAGFGGGDGSGPADGEVIGGQAGDGAGGGPVEVDLFVGASKDGLGVKVVAGEVLGFEAVRGGVGVGVEQGAGDGHGDAFGVGGALGVEDVGVGELGDDAVDGEDGVAGDGVVVAFDGGERGGVGADDGDGAEVGFQGEEAALIFEQDHGLVGGLESQSLVRGGVDLGEGDGGVGHFGGGIEEAETEARDEEALEGGVDLGLLDEAFVDGGGEGTVGSAAVGVGAGADAGDGGGFGVGGEVVAVLLEEVVDGPAVGGDVAFEGPVAAEDVPEEHLAGAGGGVVDGVVGAHDGVGAAFGDRGAEGGQVGVPEVVRGGVDVGRVTGGLGAGVDGVVLGGGDDLEVVGVVALEAFDEGDAEAAGEEGVFAVGLLTAAPARVAEDVDVGRPDREAEVDGVDVVAEGFAVFGAGLGGDGGGDAAEQGRVPGGGHADGLREHGGVAGAGDAVEAFVPPVVGGGRRDAGRRGRC